MLNSLKNEAQKPKTIKKMLRKPPVSNTWAAVFKNNDFSESPLSHSNE